MSNAQSKKKTIKVHTSPLINCRKELPGRGWPPTFPVFQFFEIAFVAVSRLQRKYVSRAADQTILEKGFNLLGTQPFDIERITRHKVLQPFNPLRRANKPARTSANHIFFACLLIHLSHGMAAAFGANLWKHKRRGVIWPFLQHHPYNLRYHISRPLDHDMIANAHILARQFFLIVKRRIGDHHTPNRYRLKARYRCERARATDLNINTLQDRDCLLRRKLVRNSPAWAT